MTGTSLPDLLLELVGDPASAFFIVARRGQDGSDQSFVATGEARTEASIRAACDRADSERTPVVLAIPYNSISERGFCATRPGPPLLSMTCERLVPTSREELLAILPSTDAQAGDTRFDISDAEYAGLVRRVIDDEIGAGEGANFVLHRSLNGRFDGFSTRAALGLFARLLRSETGAYWTFIASLPDRFLIGASPELHVSQDERGTVRMNPISGTLRYGASAPSSEDILKFLSDTKEREELFMVVDEELKILSRVGNAPPRVIGPYLKRMSHVAHTEYLLEVSSDADAATVLLESLPAPTVTGSPLENACRVIGRREATARDYYSGVMAFLDPCRGEGHELDSAILIRTADIGSDGSFSIGTGATIVRHSAPDEEALETAAKAAGVLNALSASQPATGGDARIERALADRNHDLAQFWLDGRAEEARDDGRAASVLLVDYEDRFTDMLVWQLRSLGCSVTVRSHSDDTPLLGHDLVVLGPGPGDPNAHDGSRIDALRGHIDQMLATRQPFLAVCLSHQLLSHALGLPVVRLRKPNQGTQKTIRYFDREARVAFYNAYSAVFTGPVLNHPDHGRIDVAFWDDRGHVAGMRAEWFESFQFHPESLLSTDGRFLLRSALTRLSRAPEAVSGP